MSLFSILKKPAAAELITDQATVDREYKRGRMAVMGSITLGYAFMYTTRLPLSVVKKPLIDGGVLSANDLGIVGSGLFYGYAFGKCINGFLADHAHLKRFFALGILFSALVNLAMGGIAHLFLWTALWGLNGWFQGFGAPVSAVTLANWFSKKERGTFYGIWSTSHSIGEFLTFVGTAAVVTALGWRYGFIAPGALGLAVAFLVFLYMRNQPETMGLPPVAEWRNDVSSEPSKAKTEKLTFLQQLAILKHPAIWRLGLASAMMYVTRYAVNSWGVLYLQEEKGYSLIRAGSVLGVNNLAGLAGAIFYGLLSDRVFKGRRPPVTALYGLVEIAALTFIFFGPTDNPILLGIAFGFYGFTLAGLLATLGGLFAIDIVPKKIAGAAMGLIGIFSYIGAGIQELISGHLIENNTTIVNGVRHYDFSVPILFWIGASVVSFLLALSLWNTKVTD
jgi:OPA family sugar phosphate sensor protein UhpC-like MFS transporter